MSANRRSGPWSDEDVARAFELRRCGADMAEIGRIVGRTAKSVATKLRTKANGTSWRGKLDGAVPSPQLMAERDRRYHIAPRDLTAALLGDPLPGYSALDRRGQTTK